MVGCVSQTERPLKIRPSLNFLRLCESPQACSFFSESQAWWNFHRSRLHHTQQPGLSSDRDLDHRSHSSACPSPLCQASLSCGPSRGPDGDVWAPWAQVHCVQPPRMRRVRSKEVRGGSKGLNLRLCPFLCASGQGAGPSPPGVRVPFPHFRKAAMGTHLPGVSTGANFQPTRSELPRGSPNTSRERGEAGDNSRSPLYRLQQFCSGSKFAHSHQKNKNACHRDRLPQRTTH